MMHFVQLHNNTKLICNKKKESLDFAPDCSSWLIIIIFSIEIIVYTHELQKGF